MGNGDDDDDDDNNNNNNNNNNNMAVGIFGGAESFCATITFF